MEVIGPEWRSACGIWFSGTFAIGYGLLSPMAYIFPSWRDLQLSLAFFSVPLFIAMFFIKDSPRFLIAKNRPKEAEDWLKEIGRKNRKSEQEMKNVKINDDLIKQVNGEGGVDEQSYSIADLFNRGRVMTMITLNCMFLWFVCSLTYYGFSLNAAALPTSLYVSNLFYAASELPAYALASWMVEKPQFGRKNTMSGCLLIGGALSYLSTVFSELSICEKDAENPFENGFVVAGFVVSILGKAAISMSFSIVYNVTAELFPTQVRANAVGLCSMIARIGGIIAPIFLALYNVYSWAPGVLFGTFAITAGVFGFFLPETQGIPMLMNFDDALLLYTGQMKRTRLE